MSFFGLKIAGFATALCFCVGFSAQAAPLETRATSLRAALGNQGVTPTVPSGRYGYVLMDAMTGEILSGRNADDLFIPASLAKIPTTLVTLDALGEDRRFETRLIADGDVRDGVLTGNLHLVGSGDPSLRARDLAGLAKQLAEAGVKRVSGRFTFNAEALPRTAMIDAAQPAAQHYNPPIAGLNVDLNLGSLRGKRVPVTEPGRRAARMLRQYAAARGIALPPPVRTTRTAPGETLATHRSAPVAAIAKQMMARSTNLTAEALGALAAESRGTAPKSLSDAARMTGGWLKAEAGAIGGAGWAGFRLENHSGLSTRSRATPRQMAAILRLGYQRFGTRFTDLHKNNAPGGYQAYTLRGKTGTMRFVRGYGGFLTVGGRDMIFAIMTNDSHRRALADAGRSGLHSAAWMNKARRLEHRVLSEWVTQFWQSDAAPQVAVAEQPTTVPLATDTSFLRATALPRRRTVAVDMSKLLELSPEGVRSTSLVE